MVLPSHKLILFLAFILYSLSGCSNDAGHNTEGVAAKINDFSLSKKDFQSQLVRELEYDEAYKTTVEAKREFLKSIIEKELLTQEAKRLGLDRDEHFVSAIEKYWQATLIKHLMERKNQEIKKTVSVSQKEVQQMYDSQKKTNQTLPPLSEIETDIVQATLASKRGAALDKWIREIHDNADIKINHDFINE